MENHYDYTHDELLEEDLDDEGSNLRSQTTILNYGRVGGTLSAELYRTAEMLVDIAEKQGVYFAIALLYDSAYDTDRISTNAARLVVEHSSFQPSSRT